jgi:hypothetical protein
VQGSKRAVVHGLLQQRSRCGYKTASTSSSEVVTAMDSLETKGTDEVEEEAKTPEPMEEIQVVRPCLTPPSF